MVVRIVIGLVAAWALACAPPPAFTFHGPKEAIPSALAQVAIVPETSEDLAPLTDSLHAYLSAQGVGLLPATRSREIREEALSTAGPLFDARSGTPNEEAFQRFHESFRAQARSMGATALLYPSVATVTAELSQGSAFWCGRMQNIRTADQAEDARSTSIRGHLPALCLQIELISIDGDRLYSGEGGIHVLSEFDPHAHIATLRMIDIPPSEAISDREDIDWAVELALEPLVSAR